MCEIDHTKGFWVKYSIGLALKHCLHPDYALSHIGNIIEIFVNKHAIRCLIIYFVFNDFH